MIVQTYQMALFRRNTDGCERTIIDPEFSVVCDVELEHRTDECVDCAPMTHDTDCVAYLMRSDNRIETGICASLEHRK